MNSTTLDYCVKCVRIKRMGEAIKVTPERRLREVFPNGTVIDIEVLDPLPLDVDYGDVDEHEAEHALIVMRNGGYVIEACTIPHGNVGGYVQPGGFDAEAASTSYGRAGCAHDQQMVDSRLGKGSFAAIGKSVRGRLNRDRMAVKAFAGLLAKEKRVNGSRLQQILDQVDFGEKVRVTVTRPDGTRQVFDKRVQKGGKLEMTVPNGRPKKADEKIDIPMFTPNARRSDIVTDKKLRTAA